MVEEKSNKKGDLGVNKTSTENISTVDEMNKNTLLDSNKVGVEETEYIPDESVIDVKNRDDDNVMNIANSEISNANIPDENVDETAHEKTIKLEIELVKSIEENIADQIDAQLGLMLAREISDKIGYVQVAKVNADGHCMFGSLSHQIYGFKLGSDEHINSVSQLRREVVEFIKINIDLFTHEMKNRLYDERSKNSIKGRIVDLENEANHFLSNKLASYIWGGPETLKAIMFKYNTNILIINEEGDCKFQQGFHSNFDKTLIIAYRTNPYFDISGTGGERNHYDSVVGMGSKTKSEISRALTIMIPDNLDDQEVIDIS